MPSPEWIEPFDLHYRAAALPAVAAEETLRHAFNTGLEAVRDQAAPLLWAPAPDPRPVPRERRIHAHRYGEVAIVRRGTLHVWWEGRVTACPEGSVLLFAPGVRYQPHVAAAGPPAPHSVFWLALHRACAIVHPCALEGETHYLGQYYSFTEPQITPLARGIVQELSEQAPGCETALRGYLMALLVLLGRAPAYPVSERDAPDLPAAAPPGEDLRSRTEAFLLSHYHRPLSLPDVARALGCSPAHLCRQYRKEAGRTPFEFLREVRMEAARRLLRSHIPIARVAQMVGFEDPSYFSRVFAAATGRPPQAYRSETDPDQQNPAR